MGAKAISVGKAFGRVRVKMIIGSLLTLDEAPQRRVFSPPSRLADWVNPNAEQSKYINKRKSSDADV